MSARGYSPRFTTRGGAAGRPEGPGCGRSGGGDWPCGLSFSPMAGW